MVQKPGQEDKMVPYILGSNPHKGIMYYKATDLENGLFKKWKISNLSSARLAIGYIYLILKC